MAKVVYGYKVSIFDSSELDPLPIICHTFPKRENGFFNLKAFDGKVYLFNESKIDCVVVEHITEPIDA